MHVVGCVLGCSTYYGFLNDEYASKIKSEKDVKEMSELDDNQRKILKGFLNHINFVYAEPSELDRQAVVGIYHDHYRSKLQVLA